MNNIEFVRRGEEAFYQLSQSVQGRQSIQNALDHAQWEDCEQRLSNRVESVAQKLFGCDPDDYFYPKCYLEDIYLRIPEDRAYKVITKIFEDMIQGTFEINQPDSQSDTEESSYSSGSETSFYSSDSDIDSGIDFLPPGQFPVDQWNEYDQLNLNGGRGLRASPATDDVHKLFMEEVELKDKTSSNGEKKQKRSTFAQLLSAIFQWFSKF